MMASTHLNWQRVQLNRGRPRPLIPFRDNVNRARMDRAHPGPSGSRVRYPHPNWPVPPEKNPVHNIVPQHRFSTGRQRGLLRPPNRFTPLLHRQAQTVQRPADPALGRLIRKMHMIIKVVHHLYNVTPNSERPRPKGVTRMTNVLATMIKPASPVRGND